MVSLGAAAALPILAELKQASERWVRRERARARFTSGVQALDGLLGGGWPQGKVGELVGPASSGRSAVAAATVAAATARGEVTAWLDAADAFDPASAAAAGVDLGRLLWVRTRDAVETVRAAELVLETGGFTVVVLDLGTTVRVASRRDGVWERRSGPCGRPGWVGASPTPMLEGARKGALRLRLARAVERAGAVALVLAERPWAGTLAGTMVALRRGEARWDGARGGPRWLDGLVLHAQVERGGSRDRAAEPREERNAGATLAAARESDVGAKDRVPGDTHEIPVIARSPGFIGATKQSRCVHRTAAELDVQRKGEGTPRPDEDATAHVSVGRALRACPEDVDGSSREHARSARSTETGVETALGA